MRRPTFLPSLLALPVLAFVACGGGSGSPGAPTPPPPAAPVVASFTASAPRIVQGESVTLSATFTGGTAVLAPGGQPLQSGVPVTVNPTATTTYSVTVTGPGGTAAATAKVGVEAFTAVGSMGTPRLWATATLLPNGKVLVAGGYNGLEPMASAEIFDPAMKTFTPTGAMAKARFRHVAVALSDGKVLIAGGGNKTCEIYDPATGAFQPSATLAADRLDLSGTLLKDGRVLLAFGVSGKSNKPVAGGEYFDPATGALSPALVGVRWAFAWHSAVALPEGGAVLVGGYDGDFPLRLNADGTVTDYSKLIRLPATRYGQAFLKGDGRLLIPGGGHFHRPTSVVTAVDLAASTSTEASALSPARTGYQWASAGAGSVLLAGGSDGVAALDSAVLLDLATGQTRPTAKLLGVRNRGVAVKLADGRLLVLGGTLLPTEGTADEDGDRFEPRAAWPAPSEVLATAELFDPGH
jgi:hypothetical protein